MITTYRRAEPVFVDGRGAVLRDRDGREYLDFLGGIAVAALGHAHPVLTEVLRDQIGRTLHVSNLFRHEYTERVAGALAELSGLEAVFFSNSGTEAVEAALKIARKHHELRGEGDRDEFVALEGGFHGRTLGALSVTGTEAYRTPFGPLLAATFVAPGDDAALERALARRPAALILEPIQGEAGIVELGHDFLRLSRELCDRTGTILIHDEVQCGTGRTGRFLCSAHAGVIPDVATLAKPLANGLPMGATLVRADLAETLQPGDHGSTFGGGPLACRAALVLLDLLRGGLLAQVALRGARLRAGLEHLSGEFAIVREVRGRGLMLGLRLEHDAPRLVRELLEYGLVTNCTAGDVVRFLPPYIVTDQQIDQALDLVHRALRRL